MICNPCATQADQNTTTGHPADLCEDNGKDIRACACQHKPSATREPHGAAGLPGDLMEGGGDAA